MVFQDPYSSLNPRMTVADIIGEPLDVHQLYANRKERQERVIEHHGAVSASTPSTPPATPTSSPAASASASASPGPWRSNPNFIVCDEPVSALDVSIQAQVINMFEELQERAGR